MSRRKILFTLLQIGIWVAFLALPYFMFLNPPKQDAMRQYMQQHPGTTIDWATAAFWSSLPFNIFLIIFFYTHHYLLFPKLVLRRKVVEYGVAVLGSFVLILILNYYIKNLFFHYLPEFQRDFSIRDFIRYLTWFMLVMLISLGINLLLQWLGAEKRAGDIKTEQLRTELAMLHAQINPHFLFNSLNTVYSLALKKSDVAPEAVLKLSQLLRYVIEDADHDKVRLEQEVNYLNDYIELQKLRTTTSTAINFEIKGDISSTVIAPLLFLPFVENAFKYGISNKEQSAIDIVLHKEEDKLTFMVTNRKFYNLNNSSTGIGINNVKRRLNLLYPNTHRLTINDTDAVYSVNLIIQL